MISGYNTHTDNTHRQQKTHAHGKHQSLQLAVSYSICIWPLRDIAITTIVWFTAYKRGVGKRAYIAQWACSSIAIGSALQVGWGDTRMMDTHNKALKRNNIL